MVTINSIFITMQCARRDLYNSTHIKTLILHLKPKNSWWRHQMETFSALLTICAGNPGEFLVQRPVTRSFDVFFDLRLNKRLSKQSRSWWFETPSRPLYRHCNIIGAGKHMTNLPRSPLRDMAHVEGKTTQHSSVWRSNYFERIRYWQWLPNYRYKGNK